MLELIEGNLLEAEADALVNTVNTEGVMGKGVALQFAKKFPDMLAAYKAACKAGEVLPGRMHIFERGEMFQPRYIINFPTKRHWRRTVASPLCQGHVWPVCRQPTASVAPV